MLPLAHPLRTLMTAEQPCCASCRLLYDSQVVPAVCSALRHAVINNSGSSRSVSGRPDPAAGPDGLVAVLTSALLQFSYCPHLCEQLLEAGLLPVLSTLLCPEAAAGMSSKLSIQVGAGSVTTVGLGRLGVEGKLHGSSCAPVLTLKPSLCVLHAAGSRAPLEPV